MPPGGCVKPNSLDDSRAQPPPPPVRLGHALPPTPAAQTSHPPNSLSVHAVLRDVVLALAGKHHRHRPALAAHVEVVDVVFAFGLAELHELVHNLYGCVCKLATFPNGDMCGTCHLTGRARRAVRDGWMEQRLPARRTATNHHRGLQAWPHCFGREGRRCWDPARPLLLVGGCACKGSEGVWSTGQECRVRWRVKALGGRGCVCVAIAGTAVVCVCQGRGGKGCTRLRCKSLSQMGICLKQPCRHACSMRPAGQSCHWVCTTSMRSCHFNPPCLHLHRGICLASDRLKRPTNRQTPNTSNPLAAGPPAAVCAQPGPPPAQPSQLAGAHMAAGDELLDVILDEGAFKALRAARVHPRGRVGRPPP